MERKEFLKEFENTKRIVVKIGSNLIVNSKQSINYEVLNNLLNDIIILKDLNKQIILVSSGAVALGKKKLNTIKKNQKIEDFSSIVRKQALASIGQIELMKFYDEFFGKKNLGISQILITANDFGNRQTYLNIGHTIQEILNLGLIPIINENDTVSIEELKFGDNDFLSAATAALLNAQILILLTSVDGFFINNQRVSYLDKITNQVLSYAKGPEGYGSGGMYSKIRVGKLCLQAGLHVAILPGKEKNIIQKFLRGEDVGTFIYSTKKFMKAKKKWLLFARTKGSVIIDKGAENALIYNNSSLLLAGIKKIQGNFTYRDVVDIKNQEDQIIGRGVINIPSKIIKEKINQRNVGNLNYHSSYSTFPIEIIHRDNMIIEEL